MHQANKLLSFEMCFHLGAANFKGMTDQFKNKNGYVFALGGMDYKV